MSIVVHPDQAIDSAPIANLLTDKHQVSLVTARGVQAESPQGLRQVLDAAAQALMGGREVIVGTKDTYVTTQQAADYLGVSRPTMVRILDLGDFPSERPASRRRIKLADLADHAQKMASRRAGLNRLLETSDEMTAHDGGFVATR